MRFDYLCANCKHEFEIEQRISDDILKLCPECQTEGLERVILEAPLVFDMTPKTVGTLCERNTKEMGTYGREEKRRVHAEKKKEARKAAKAEMQKNLPAGAKLAEDKPHQPWYGKLDKKFKNANGQRLTKYIMEGK